MNKNLKIIIACTAALVVVGGGYFALMYTDLSNTGSESVSSSSEAEPIAKTNEMLLKFEKTDIRSITVENKNGGYEGVPTGEKGEDGLPLFAVKGTEDLNPNTSAAASLLNSASALSCEKLVSENEKDLEKYGLSDPQAAVTVKTDKEEKTLLVGSESPESGTTYCMIKGESKVYLAGTSAVSVFTNSKENFLSTELIPSAQTQGEVPGTIKIERDDISYDIVLKKDDGKSESGNSKGTMSTHYMEEPVFSYLDDQKSQDVITKFYGLSAYTAIYSEPDEKTIEATGIKNPFCTVTADIGGKTVTLKIGNKLNLEDGEYFAVMKDSLDVIYAVSADDLVWASVKPGDITSKMIFGTYVWDVGTLKLSTDDGQEAEFNVKGNSEDEAEVMRDGKPADKERFKQFYQFLLKASAEEFTMDEEPQGSLEASIELVSQGRSVKQKVEFYKSEGKKSLIVVNGVACFKCRTAYVDLLKQNLSKFDGNEEFVMNW